MSETETVTESGQTGDDNRFDGLPPEIGQEALDAAPEQAEQEKPAAQPDRRPENGYQPFVDLSAIPDEATRKAVEARFAHFSRLMKKSEQKYSGELNQWRDVAAQQSKLLEELQGGVGAVVDHLQTKSLDDAESQWKAAMRTAFEAGDVNAQMDANDKLIEIRTKKALLKEQQKAQKPQDPQRVETKPNGQYPSSATEIGGQGLANGEITQDDVRALEAWQEESDEIGSQLRPWAYKDDPRHQQALIEAVAVFKNPQYSKASFEQKLSEIDRRMGVKKASNSQKVMGGGLNGVNKTPRLTLSSDIEKLAIRTKFGGPKAKTDEDHIQAYIKQMNLVKSKKGAR